MNKLVTLRGFGILSVITEMLLLSFILAFAGSGDSVLNLFLSSGVVIFLLLLSSLVRDYFAVITASKSLLAFLSGDSEESLPSHSGKGTFFRVKDTIIKACAAKRIEALSTIVIRYLNNGTVLFEGHNINDDTATKMLSPVLYLLLDITVGFNGVSQEEAMKQVYEALTRLQNELRENKSDE